MSARNAESWLLVHAFRRGERPETEEFVDRRIKAVVPGWIGGEDQHWPCKARQHLPAEVLVGRPETNQAVDPQPCIRPPDRRALNITNQLAGPLGPLQWDQEVEVVARWVIDIEQDKPGNHRFDQHRPSVKIVGDLPGLAPVREHEPDRALHGRTIEYQHAILALQDSAKRLQTSGREVG